MHRKIHRSLFTVSIIFVATILPGCLNTGPEPEVVPFVDVERYVGLWHEIASNPSFFNMNLVAVTAEYDIIGPGRISVLNRGRVGTPDGRERSIEGSARIVDTTTNAKLKVQFDTFWGRFFEGNYWIVLLDDAEYEYTVVSDNQQRTLFVLYREPVMPQALYNAIVLQLDANGIDSSRLRITGVVTDAT